MKMAKALFGILSVTLGLLAPAQAQSYLTEGLAAYYPFTGNANDATGNGFDLINYGATLCPDRFGHPNQAYSFNGTTYLGSPVPPISEVTDCTLTAWILVPVPNQNPGFAVCLGENASVNDGLGFGVSDGNELYALFPGIAFSPDGYVFLYTNIWYQVAMTRSSGVATLYVNGAPTSDTFSASPGPATSFEVGSGGTAIYFTGEVDDVRVYDRALSAEEVQELYQYELVADATPQAVAVTEVTNGFVVGVVVTFGGFGYTRTPAVTFTGGGGGGAEAVAVVNNGVVTGINILDAGSNYTNAPAVVIESPVDFHPFPATATAYLTNTFVVGATVTYGGYGYTNVPEVRIIGGGGTGAQAVAVVNAGVVEAIDFLDAGYGYTNTPLVVIEPPFIPQPTISIASAWLLSFSKLSVGANYQFQLLTNGIWANIGSPFTAAGSNFSQYVSGLVSSNNYRIATTPVPVQAYATAQVVNGFVVGATVTAGGSGYLASPAVTISGSSGSNATATATVSGGAVASLTILDAGDDYTNATIAIAPPPANAVSPNVTPMWGLNFGLLSPYDNYQLQFSPDLSGAWSNLGAPFAPTATTNAYYFNANGPAGFFRLIYLP
jgi:hypothetical protein